MEAFILADRVVTKQHMSRLDQKEPKYLKKYDLPSPMPRMQQIPRARRKMKENTIRQSYPTASLKVRNLLSTITEGMCCRHSQDKPTQEANFDKYFSCQTDPSENPWEARKPKEALLIRPIQPQPQHYDPQISHVSPRAPCWTFAPHNRQIGTPQATTKMPPESKIIRAKTAEKLRGGGSRKKCVKRASESEEWVLQKAQRKIYEQMRQRSGLEHEHEGRLQYWPQELGRGTAEIFKKYHLANEAYFKKFLADIQNLAH